MSADNVIGRSHRARRNRAEQIRDALVIAVIVLFTYSETSVVKDRVNVIGGRTRLSGIEGARTNVDGESVDMFV